MKNIEMLNSVKSLKIALAMIAGTLLFSSCEKPEDPIVVEPVDTSLTTVTITLGSEYANQTYFSLNDYSEVSTNLRTDWDLGIREYNGEQYIYLNGARSMNASITGLAFEEVDENTETSYKWDKPHGDIDSLVIGTQRDSVFLVDMGYDNQNEHMGYKKIKFVDNKIVSADLDGKNEFSQELTANSEVFITPISLTESIATDLSPNSADWDILFTRYTHEFSPTMPYGVTGLILNPNNIAAAIDTTHSFENIDYSVVTSKEYSSDFDAIGYDWKSYSIEAGSYTIHSDKYFIIKSSNNEYYKLRFKDFYDEQGNKGTITFDIVRVVE